MKGLIHGIALSLPLWGIILCIVQLLLRLA